MWRDARVRVCIGYMPQMHNDNANRIESTSVEFVHLIGEAIERVYMPATYLLQTN